MICPCGEDIDPLAERYSRSKDVDPFRCADCLDIIFRKKWRDEKIIDRIIPQKKADPPSKPIRRRRHEFPDEADNVDMAVIDHISKRIKQSSPKIKEVIRFDPRPDPYPPPSLRSRPDPNCSICGLAQTLGKVVQCPCMKL